VESLARLFVAATELLEAEGWVLKRQFVRLFIAAGLGLIILGLVVTGLGFLFFSLYKVLVPLLTPAGAALAAGLVALLLAFAVLLCAKRILR
jgi:hypothetical protein